jgi:hypothetical protein
MKKHLLYVALLTLAICYACQREVKVEKNGKNVVNLNEKYLKNDDLQLGFKLTREEGNGVTIWFQKDFTKLRNYIFFYRGNYEFSYVYDEKKRIYSCRFENPNTQILLIDLDNREVIKEYRAADNPCEDMCCECKTPDSDDYICEGTLTPYWGDEPGWSCTCENIMDCSDCQPCIVTVIDNPSHYLFVDAAYVNFRDL